MSKAWRISRRTVLRGLGTAMALPLLDAMAAGDLAWRRTSKQTAADAHGFRLCAQRHAHAGLDARGRRRRFRAALHSGAAQAASKTSCSCSAAWRRTTAGRTATGRATMPARCRAFSPASKPRKTHGADIKVGVSVDQVAARKVGQQTKFPSLELGCDRGPQAGNCDSGYSCSYSTNISWRSDTTPQAKEIDPEAGLRAAVFDGAGARPSARSKRDRYRKSILDFVLEDARRLASRSWASRTGASSTNISARCASSNCASARPASNPAEPVAQLSTSRRHSGRLRRAHPADVRPDGAGVPGRPDARLDVRRRQRRQQSGLSVHRRARRPPRSVASRRQSRKNRPRFARSIASTSTQLAYFLEKLKASPKGERTLLDNSMIVYGSGIGDGNAHNHDNLPILLAGRGGGTHRPGRHVRYEKETPLNNLYLSMLDRMDSSVEALGDSTGRLESLS